MRGKTTACGNGVIVDHPERTEPHVTRIIVVREGERVVAVEPAVISVSAVLGSSYRRHLPSPVLIGLCVTSLRRGRSPCCADRIVDVRPGLYERSHGSTPKRAFTLLGSARPRTNVGLRKA